MMILCGLLPLLISGIRAIKDVKVCSNQPADIGFLIDESGSVSQTNFNINLDLVKKFVDDFEIGNNAVKISVFAFHQLIGDGFYFSCCHSKASIKSEIDNINFASGGEDFEMALTFAKSYMFQSVNGARSCQSPIHNASSLLHQLGVLVYAIGVGSGVNKDTLNKIATNESYVFMMPSYSDLLGEGYSNITSQICIDVLTNPCERIPKPCKNTETCVWTGGSRCMCLGINGSTDNNCTKDVLTNPCERIPKPCKNAETCIWTGGSRYMCLGINGSTDNNCPKDPLVQKIIPFAREYNVQSLLERIKEWLEVQASTRNDDAKFILMAFAMASEYGFFELYKKLAGNLMDLDQKSVEWFNEYKRLKDEDQIFLLNLRCEKTQIAL